MQQHEEYHQDYLQKNPNGYWPIHATAASDNTALKSGKHIVVLKAPFCPYCEQFKKNVSNDYQGEIPLHYRQAEQLDGLQLSTPIWATPTIFI